MTVFLKKNETETIALFFFPLSSMHSPAQEENQTNTCVNKCALSMGEISLKITDWSPPDFLFLTLYF